MVSSARGHQSTGKRRHIEFRFPCRWKDQFCRSSVACCHVNRYLWPWLLSVHAADTPSICLSIYDPYEIANGPTDTPPQSRGFVPCHRHFSHDRPTARIHTTNTMIYRWFTITENAVVTRNAFKTHRVFSRWCLWQTAAPRYQSPFCVVHDRNRNTSSGNRPLCFCPSRFIAIRIVNYKLCRSYVNNRLNWLYYIFSNNFLLFFKNNFWFNKM